MTTGTLNIRCTREGDWFFVDNKLIREYGRELGPHGIAVYSVLAMHANNKTQQADPSFDDIAGMLNISRRHVIRMCKLLQQHGIIHIEKRSYTSKNGKKTHKPSLITLLKPEEWLPVESEAIVSDYAQGSDSQSLGNDEAKKEEKNTPPSDSQSPGVVTHSHPNTKTSDKTNTKTNSNELVSDKPPPPKPKTEISNHFLEVTKLKMPKNKPGIKFYWAQVQELLHLGDNDPAKVNGWIDQIVPYMRSEGLSIVGPQSVKNLCNQLSSGQPLRTSKNGNHQQRSSTSTANRERSTLDDKPTFNPYTGETVSGVQRSGVSPSGPANE